MTMKVRRGRVALGSEHNRRDEGRGWRWLVRKKSVTALCTYSMDQIYKQFCLYAFTYVWISVYNYLVWEFCSAFWAAKHTLYFIFFNFSYCTLFIFLCTVLGKILENEGVKYLRMANDRGWTTASDADAGGRSPLFIEVEGDLVPER